MKIIYIRESIQTCDIIKRIIIKVRCFLNKVYIEKKDNRVIYNLPIYANKNISIFRINKLSKRIIKNLEKDEVTVIVLSKYLHTLKCLKDNLYIKNIDIIEGRYLFKCLTYKIIEYIIKIQNKCMEELDVSILVNEFNNINKNLIVKIAKEVKTLKIVTNNIDKCKEIEKFLYGEFGILVDISNNKKTSLANSQIILNFDFSEDVINKYRINDKAIIINFLGRRLIKSKKFNGININYFKIKVPKKYNIDGFRTEDIYESEIYNKEIYEVEKKTLDDKIKIIKLIGNNGSIKEKEYMDKIYFNT